MNKLPKEIIDHIYEYNAEHRIKFKECVIRIPNYKLLNQIPLGAVSCRITTIINLFDKEIEENNNWDFSKLLKENLNEPGHFVKILNKCKCCKRHQMNRPNLLNNTKYILQDTKNNTENEVCNCLCRHISRRIVQSFNLKTIYKNIPFTTEWIKYMESDY